MKDIDFDELDRAVSTAMSSVPSDAPQDETPPLTVPVRETTPPAPSIPAARRTGGRFMDVVHPSSDMRTSVPAPSKPQIEPVKEAVTPVASPAPTVGTDISPITDDTADGQDFSWPDPLEMSESPAPVATTDTEVQEFSPSMTPLESPFIDGAKVEKRPLGAFSEAQQAATLDLSAELEQVSNELDEADGASSESNAPQDISNEQLDISCGALLSEDAPEQVSNELDEADGASSESNAPQDISNEQLEVSEESLIGSSDIDETSSTTEQTPPEEVPPAPKVEEPAPLPTTVPIVSDTLAPIAAASIPQQYKEHPVSDDQPSGSIYDTETYHQALTHPQKKPSSWPIILWIIGLILFGAGIGLALYFFVLPQL